LQLLRKFRDRIDLVITDIRIPGDMDGLDLAHLARKSLPDLPVILISPDGDNAPAGFEFVHKPFRPAAIFNAITALNNRRHAAS
jgi:DNA-binding response OmpR family regulator